MSSFIEQYGLVQYKPGQRFSQDGAACDIKGCADYRARLGDTLVPAAYRHEVLPDELVVHAGHQGVVGDPFGFDDDPRRAGRVGGSEHRDRHLDAGADPCELAGYLDFPTFW
jgi:hypothetical protein